MSWFSVSPDGYVNFNTDYISWELLPSIYTRFWSLFNFVLEFSPVWIPIAVFFFIYLIIRRRKASSSWWWFSLFWWSKRLPDEVVQYRQIQSNNRKQRLYWQWFRSWVRPKRDKWYKEYCEQQTKSKN